MNTLYRMTQKEFEENKNILADYRTNKISKDEALKFLEKYR